MHGHIVETGTLAPRRAADLVYSEADQGIDRSIYPSFPTFGADARTYLPAATNRLARAVRTTDQRARKFAEVLNAHTFNFGLDDPRKWCP